MLRVLLAVLAMAGVAEAQTTLPDPAPSPFAVNAADGLFHPADQPSGQPSWAAERRACEGCPRRSVGHAFVDVTIINVFYGLANLVRGQVTARVTPKTWWANMEQGWVWDLDDFVVNQIGHPYQGNNYFNAARANGLSFWESAGLTAFGSGTWEYFGETNHASLNDLINTTLGGIALGEMFHRMAWLVRDHASDRARAAVEGDRRHGDRSRDRRQAIPVGRFLPRVRQARGHGAVETGRHGLARRALARLEHRRLLVGPRPVSRTRSVVWGSENRSQPDAIRRVRRRAPLRRGRGLQRSQSAGPAAGPAVSTTTASS